MIKALLYKDFVNIKSYSITMLFVGIFISVLINQPGFSTIATVLASSLVFTSFALDENSGHLKEEIAAFGNRKIILLEKYILMFIFLIIGTLFSFCSESIFGLIRNNFSLNFSLFCALISFAFGLIVCSLALPFIVRLGAEKGRFVVILCVLLPMVFLSLLSNIADIETLSSGFITILLILTALTAAPISYFVSYLLMQDKDF